MVMMDVGHTVLHAEDIHKRHPGVDALRGVTLSLNRGEVQVLLGVDGGGKSTLVKILAGVVQPDSGALYVDGRLVTIDTPRAAAALGIGAVHQEVRLVPSMSVISNILLDYAPQRRLLLVLPLIDWRKVEAAADEALNLLDIRLDLNARAQDLSPAQQQMAKIVKALAGRPRILLLDEPTYALSDGDTNRLFRAIRALVARGTSVLYVSHQINEIPRIADRVTLMKEGRTLSTMPADQADLRFVVEMLVAETSQAMAIREADRLRREFVSLVSHELRTPLATIRGYAETVMSRSWSDEIRQECLENIGRGCERLTELVDNLLDMSSLEKGTLRIEKEQVALAELAKQVTLALWRRSRGVRDIVLRFPPDFPEVWADPKRIEQVFNNLLDNAVKYCLHDQTISVAGVVDEAARRVVVTVEDEGVGIPAEHLERVFERFYRVPNPDTGGVEGSGLGLSICKGIIERHGGQMWVTSTVGKGSLFSFSLPLDLESPGESGAR
jgi:ABC-type sugar transport system ATPase subunit